MMRMSTIFLGVIAAVLTAAMATESRAGPAESPAGPAESPAGPAESPAGPAESARPMTAESFCRQNPPAGLRVTITGKYGELIDHRLFLVGCSISLQVDDPALHSQLLELTPGKDNLTVDGTVTEDAAQKTVQVKTIRRAPEDYALHLTQLNQLTAGSGTRAAAELVALGVRILRSETVDERDPRLDALAREAFRAAVESVRRGQATDPVDSEIRLVRRIHAELADNVFARDALTELALAHPEDERVEAELEHLKCHRHGDRWLTEEEFMRQEGLYPHEGRWISRSAKHMLLAIDAISQKSEDSVLLLRRRTTQEYMLLAESGKVEPGMSREETALALGFPTYVLRHAHNGREFDQWAYPKEYYYFFDGILVFLPKSAGD